LETLSPVAGWAFTEEQRGASRNFAVIDGEPYLVTAHADGSGRLFDASSGQASGGPLDPGSSTWDSQVDLVGGLRTVQTETGAYAMVYSDRGRHFPWDLEPGRFLSSTRAFGSPDSGYLRATLAIGGEDFRLTYGEAGEVLVHSFPEGASAGVLSGPDEAPVSAAAAVELGRHTVAVTGSEDGTIRLWDMGD